MPGDKTFQHWSLGAESASGVKSGCFQCCLRPSSLIGPRIPMVCVVCSYQCIGSCQGFAWQLEEGTSLELGRGKGPSPRSSATTSSTDSAQVDGYGMCCPSLSSQPYELLVQRGNKLAVFSRCRWLRGENRF